MDDLYLGLGDPATQLKCNDCHLYYDKDEMTSCALNYVERCERDQIQHEFDCGECSEEYVFAEGGDSNYDG